MGVSLAIASSVHGSGKTVFTFLLAHRLSKILKKEANILICCTCMADGDIRKIIGGEEDYLSLEDLINLGAYSTDLSLDIKELIYHRGNLFLIDTVKATQLFVRDNSKIYQEALGHFKQDFDLVITDTSSNPTNPLTKYILESCDHVLNIAIQDMHLLEKTTIAASKKVTHIINRYTDIYPNKKELIRLLGTKNMFTLPYCSQLQEMKNREKLYQYAGLDTKYMNDVDKLANFLVGTLNLPKEEIKQNKGRSNCFINLLKKGGKQ